MENVPIIGAVRDGCLEEDEGHLLEILSIMESLHGLDHSHSLGTWSELGNVFLHQGRWKAAEELFRRLADVSQRENGFHHDTTLAAFSDFGRALMAQGLLAKSKRLLRQAFDTLSQSPSRMSLLPYLHRMRERSSLVEELLLQEAERRINSFGIDHSNTQQGFKNLAASYLWTAQLEALRHDMEGPVVEAVSSHRDQEFWPEMTYNMADLCISM